MAEDIRVKVGFFQHYKTRLLRNLLGADAVLSLLELWSFAAQNKTKGILTNMDVNMIEVAAGWNGESGKLVEVLLSPEIGYLEKADGAYKIHDWSEHQPFVAYEEERREMARKAAESRWEKTEENKGFNADGMRDAVRKGNAERNAERNAPSPTPIPKTKDNNISHSEKIKNTMRNMPGNGKTAPVPRGAFEEIIQDLNTLTGKSFKPKTKSTRQMIKARLNEGYTLEDFLKVHRKMFKKWRGDPNMVDYLRPQTLYRPSNFESYLNASDNVPEARASPKRGIIYTNRKDYEDAVARGEEGAEYNPNL